MSRPLTDAEQSSLISRFPGFKKLLEKGNIKVINENDNNSCYNCVGWSLGFTHKWYGFPLGLEKTKEAYGDIGYVKERLSDDANVDCWGLSEANIVHASRHWKGELWSSKLGNELCITHKREDLQGVIPDYGKILASFRLHWPLSKGADRSDFPLSDLCDFHPSEVTIAEVGKTLAFQEIPSERRDDFDKAFSEWKSKWFQGNMAFDSNARSRAKGDAFDRLVKMNSQISILPLLISKLAEPDNFIALVLHEQIENDPRLRVPVDWKNLMSDQERRRQVVEQWLELEHKKYVV